MKKYTLINDTTPDRHIGCDAVVHSIRAAAQSHGYVEVACHAVSTEIVREDYERLLGDSPLIVINGEGTLHDDSRGCKNIAHFAAVAVQAGRRVALINCSYSANSRVTSELFSHCDLIAFRESASARTFAEHCPDKPTHVVCDLSLLSFGHLQRPAMAQDIVITDSVLPAATATLLDIGMRLGARYACVKDYRRFSKKNHPARLALKLAARELRRGRLRLRVALDVLTRSRASFGQHLRDAGVVVTGRFHVVMYCLRNELPFYYLASNTNKIDAVLEDAGLSVARRKIAGWADLERKGGTRDALLKDAAFTPEESERLRSYLERETAAARALLGEVFREPDAGR